MAGKVGRPPKVTEEEKEVQASTTIDFNDPVVLMKMIAEQNKKIEELSKLVIDAATKPAVETESEEDDGEESYISPDKYIRVISICPVELNLSTLGGGQGKRFKFRKFGETKRILYSDLVDVMEAHSNFLHDGYFYIADKDVIRKHGLNDEYEELLTKEKILKIVNGTTSDVVELFKSATPKQQSFICDMLIEKVRDEDPSIDLNMIDSISRISGVKIQDKGVDARFYGKQESSATAGA